MFEYFGDSYDPLNAFFNFGYPQHSSQTRQSTNSFDQIPNRLNTIFNDEFGFNSDEEFQQDNQLLDDEVCHEISQNSCQSYFYSAQTTFDGKNFVEEEREKLTQPDGKVHFATKRRLGERWYESESITNENGETSCKETWHNVPEDEIDQFKLDWSQQYNNSYSRPLSLEHSHQDQP